MKPGLFTYTRGAVPMYRLYGPAHCLFTAAGEVNGVPFSQVILCYKDNKLWWSWSDQEIRKVGKKIWEITKTEEGKNTHFQKIRDVANKAINAAETVRHVDLRALSNQDLIERQQQFFEDYCNGHIVTAVDIDAVDIVPVEKLLDLIKKQLHSLDKEKVQEIYTSEFTTGLKRTAVSVTSGVI